MILLACALLASLQDPRPAGAMRVTVLELKVHGTAVVLETPSGAVYVIDAGLKKDGYDSGRDAVAPFLRAIGAEEIAGLVVTHPHRDHYEGAEHLLKHWRVKGFVDAGLDHASIDGNYKKLRKRAPDVRAVRAGDTLKWDDALEVTVLAPSRDGVRSTDKDFLNDNSIVLRVRHGKNVFLFPGDIEEAGAEALLKAESDLKATVLVVPHHGFFDSRRFAEAVRPQIAVASCLAEYQDRKPASPGDRARELFSGAKVYVTAQNGRVEIVSDGSAVTARPQRP
jgi:competence protein ComEC